MSLISPKTQTLQAGVYVVEESTANEKAARNELIIRDARGQHWLVDHEYRNVESLPWETARRFLSLERSFLRRNEPALVIRIATPTDPNPKNRGADRARLERFKSAARDTLDSL